MFKIKVPKTVKEFAENLEHVILDGPPSQWLGVLYGAKIKAGKLTLKERSRGCLVQQALTPLGCRMKNPKGRYIGQASVIPGFVQVAPYLNGHEKDLNDMMNASDNCDLPKAVRVVKAFSAKVGNFSRLSAST